MYSANGTLLDPAMTDLVHNQARVLDPGTGGYTSYDRVASGGSELLMRGLIIHGLGSRGVLYSYAGARPTTAIDATGHWPSEDDPLDALSDSTDGTLDACRYTRRPGSDAGDDGPGDPRSTLGRCNCICENGTRYNARDWATCQRYCAPYSGRCI